MKQDPAGSKTHRAVKALLGAALASCSSLALAASANLYITSFTASAETYSGNYVWTLDAYQNFRLTAQDAGGLNGADTDIFESDDWDLGPNRQASTTYATVSGNTVRFTDPMTQLATAGFNLNASAVPGAIPVGAPSNYANGMALQDGVFTLIDGNGDDVAGSILFDLYYEMDVSSPVGNGDASYAQALLGLLYSTDSGDTFSFTDDLLSSDLSGGTGSKSGHFSWILNLAAGESAYYTLSGSAIASAVAPRATAVPEPAGLALFGLGLVALVATGRRGRTEKSAR